MATVVRPGPVGRTSRAGLTTWPRLWHNLRASRQTELEERFPTHVVCAWLGNTKSVARAHYLQVRDTDFERARASSGDTEAARQAVRAGDEGERTRHEKAATKRT